LYNARLGLVIVCSAITLSILQQADGHLTARTLIQMARASAAEGLRH
jgi:hypothetical protein